MSGRGAKVARSNYLSVVDYLCAPTQVTMSWVMEVVRFDSLIENLELYKTTQIRLYFRTAGGVMAVCMLLHLFAYSAGLRYVSLQ